MKRTKLGIFLSVVLVLAFLNQACALTSLVSQWAGEGAKGFDPKLWNTQLTAYYSLVSAMAKSTGEISIEFARQDKQSQLLDSYFKANIDFAKAYRDPLAQYNQQVSNGLAEASDPSKQGDLSQLIADGATPAQIGAGLAIHATIFTEAQMNLPDSTVAENAQAIMDESFSNIKVSLRDYDDQANVYNMAMNNISGEVLKQIAQYLKLKDLPPAMPLLTFVYDSTTKLLKPALAWPNGVQEVPFVMPGLTSATPTP